MKHERFRVTTFFSFKIQGIPISKFTDIKSEILRKKAFKSREIGKAIFKVPVFLRKYLVKMFVVGVIVLCFLIGSTIALKYEVKSSSQEYLVRTSYQKSGCTDAPYSLLGETLNQCIRSTNPTTASYKYVNGSKEGEIIQYHWATSATCSGNPAYSTLSIPTECGSGYYTTLSYTNESPPWSGYKPGFLFQ